MAVFATEAGVRLRVQVDDVAVASVALVEACIAEAHERVLILLDDGVDLESPPEAVVQGETVLSGAILFGALASGDSVEQVELQIGGQRVGTGQRFASLMSMARQLEKEARALLAPYGVAPGGVAVADVTTTTPVLGA